MKRLAVAFLLPIAVMLLAPGCTREPLRGSTIALNVPDSMAKWREEIYAGCKGLESEGATCMFDNHDVAVEFIYRPGAERCGGGSYLGLTEGLGGRDTGSGRINIHADCVKDGDMPTVVLHELMHWIGVDHIRDGTVMATTVEMAAQRLTPSDHAALVDLGVAD